MYWMQLKYIFTKHTELELDGYNLFGLCLLVGFIRAHNGADLVWPALEGEKTQWKYSIVIIIQ